MVGSSRAALRRREEEARARRDRLVLLGTIGVLAVTAVIVLVGVYLTVYRPPRTVVATIDGRAVPAAEVVDRATFFMVFEGGAFSTRPDDDVAEPGVDRLVRDAVLLRDAPTLVEPVTSEDIDAKIQEALGAALDADALKKARDEVLERAGITITQYRQIMEARILAERLTERFRGELPAALPQRHLERVRTPSQVNAERVIERGRAGEPFTALAVQYGADRRNEVDQGWLVEEMLLPETRVAVEALSAGEISGISVNGLFFDVYRVVEVDEARELSEEQKGLVAERRVERWIEDQEALLGVVRNLSATSSEWITQRVTARVRDAFAAQAAKAKAKR